MLHRGDFALRLADFLCQLADDGTNLLDLAMAELDRVDHFFFRRFLRARLDHHNAFGGADDHDVQLRGTHLVVRRVHDVLSIHQSNAHCANRTIERNIGDGQRRRSAVNAADIGIILRVCREHHRNDLGLAAEALGEQRADGAIDLAASEDFFFARPAFTLDESPGETSAGVGVFAVVHGQREKVDSLSRVGVGASRGEHHALSTANDRRSMRLFCKFTGFKTQGFAAGQLNRGYFWFRLHSSFFLQETPHAR